MSFARFSLLPVSVEVDRHLTNDWLGRFIGRSLRRCAGWNQRMWQGACWACKVEDQGQRQQWKLSHVPELPSTANETGSLAFVYLYNFTAFNNIQYVEFPPSERMCHCRAIAMLMFFQNGARQNPRSHLWHARHQNPFHQICCFVNIISGSTASMSIEWWGGVHVPRAVVEHKGLSWPVSNAHIDRHGHIDAAWVPESRCLDIPDKGF